MSDAPLTGPALLRAQEVADRYGVTRNTVAAWCKRGKFPGACQCGPLLAWFIPESALDGLVSRVGQWGTLTDGALSTSEVATRYGVTRGCVNDWCKRELFAGASGGGQGVAWRIPESALEEFVPPEPDESDATLSTKEVAARYGVSFMTVNRWCNQGLFPGATGGRTGIPRRIPEAALEGFVRPSEIPNTTLGTSEVAARYGVATETVRHWCHGGLFDGVTGGTTGVPWRIPEAALEGFVPPEAGRPCAQTANAPRCIACEIILDAEWCTWDAAGLCDDCQETLAVICRNTGMDRAQALAQWVGEGTP